MRRALLIATLALFTSAPAAAAGEGALAKARTTGCRPALDRVERAASFTGDMRSVPGASRLQVKFVLQARTAEEPQWRAVTAPGFGTWISSAPGIGRFVYTKTVEDLLAPATYRVRVHFRWLTSSGRTLLRARRTSKVCRQPDLRPDLVPASIERSGDGWEVVVFNAGRSAAYSFTVNVESDSQVKPFGYVEELGPGEEVRLFGQLPPCATGTYLTVHVDADAAVDEADETANVLSEACP